jgi:hypothetical protein
LGASGTIFWESVHTTGQATLQRCWFSIGENYFPPKLRINKLATIFAQHVGRVQSIFQVKDYADMAVDFEDDVSSSDESTSMESSCDTTNVNGNEPSLHDQKVFDVYDSPDPTKFP